MGKILSITERRPVESQLPDGNYIGTWGGYIITLNHKDKSYELRTEEGVRGFNIRVLVTVKDGVGTYIELDN